MPENYQEKTDEELVVLTLANQENFAYLIKKYEAKLTRYIRRISNTSPEETEDILQEIFIKAYINLNNFNPTLKFSSWIYRIAHNETISAFRKRHAKNPNYLENDQEILDKLAADIDLAAEIDAQYLKQYIWQIMEQMDQKYREVLELKFMEEKSYQEISDILRRPIGTVATLINRAKKQFHKKALEKIKA